MFAVPWGKVVDIFNFKERKKQKQKLVGLSVERLGWRKGRGGPESIALFTAHYQRAKLFYQANDWDLSREPRL